MHSIRESWMQWDQSKVVFVWWIHVSQLKSLLKDTFFS
jgi:hypothetical protein